MSAKTKQTIGGVVSFVGYILAPEYPIVGYALIIAGAALAYVGARELQKALERRARSVFNTSAVQGNIRGSFESHLMVFGKSRVGGIVVTQGSVTPATHDMVDQDLYIGVANSICHAGGTEGIVDIWLDDTHIANAMLDADPNAAVANVAANNEQLVCGAYGSTAFGNIYVVLDQQSNTFYTSSDGIQWTMRKAPWGVSDVYTCITFANGKFTALCAGQTNVATSLDGINWSITSTGLAGISQFNALVWNGSKYCAVGQGGTGAIYVATSTDGLAWTARTAANNITWNGLAWNGTVFCAVGNGTGNQAMTSPDGITWTGRAISANNWQDVAWNGTVFCAIGFGATNRAATSPDGITWTNRTAAAAVNYSGIVWASSLSLFVVTATNGTTANSVMTSPDGTTWTSRSCPNANAWNFIFLGGPFLTACATNGSTGGGYLVMNSRDGINWTSRRLYPNQLIGVAAFSFNKGTGTQNADSNLTSVGVDSSTDKRRGIAWSWGKFHRPQSDTTFSDAFRNGIPTFSVELKGLRCFDLRYGSTANAPTVYFNAVVWSSTRSLFIAACTGTGGTSFIATSPDGLAWTARSVPTSAPLTGIAANSSIIVAVGQVGKIITSPDGITWTARTAPSTKNINAVAWNGSIFCAVCDATASTANGSMTSSDGITWTGATVPLNKNYFALAWNGTVFCAVAQSGGSNDAMTASDGATWTSRAPALNQKSGIAWNGTVFCTVSSVSGNKAETSPDGITWTTRSGITGGIYTGIIWNGTAFIATRSDSAVIATSTDGTTWVDSTPPTQPNSPTGYEIAGWNGTNLVALGSSGAVAIATSASGLTWNTVFYPDRPTNWVYSTNPIVQAVTYSIMNMSDGGMGIPAPRIDVASVVSASNICDEQITTPIGTQNRFMGNGVLSTQDKLEVNLQKILDACMGRRVKVGNIYKFYAGAYRTPTVAIDSTWFSGGYKVSTLDPLESLYNAVRVNFVDADNEYKTIEAPAFTNSTYESQDGGVRLWRDLTLPMVSNTYSAQYLAMMLGKKSRYQMTIELTCNLKALDVEVWETCTLSVPEIDLSSRVFRIESWTFAKDGIALTLQEDNSSIYTVDSMVVP